jgi:hypothetical protein
MNYSVWVRQQIEVNTDPQRRCYNGVHFSSEVVWTTWTVMEEGFTKEKAERRLVFWRELNDYAVSQRGKVGTLREYEIREKEVSHA